MKNKLFLLNVIITCFLVIVIGICYVYINREDDIKIKGINIIAEDNRKFLEYEVYIPNKYRKHFTYIQAMKRDSTDFKTLSFCGEYCSGLKKGRLALDCDIKNSEILLLIVMEEKGDIKYSIFSKTIRFAQQGDAPEPASPAR